jgi:hypothetical protein
MRYAWRRAGISLPNDIFAGTLQQVSILILEPRRISQDRSNRFGWARRSIRKVSNDKLVSGIFRLPR